MVQKPRETEYAEFYRGYVALVEDSLITEVLARQLGETVARLRDIPSEMTSYRYAEGKWNIAEVLGHMIDTERVMAFRALSFARGDTSEIIGMDQEQYAMNAGYGECDFSGLIDEFEMVRRSNILFFEHLTEESWDRKGIASGHPVTVRALAYILAGHERHHMNILRERYLDEAAN